MKIAVFAFVALLSGCVTQPPPAPIEDFQGELAAALNLLHEQNIQMAVQMFGYPDSEQRLAGDNVDVWSFSQLIPISPEMPLLRITCTIQLGFDATGTIKNSHWEGDRGGCAHYVRLYQRR